MANPFEVQTINPLQALLVGDQAYQGAQKRGQQQLKEQSAQEAAQRWQAGDKQGALALLLQSGNYDAASAYGNVDQREYSRGRDVKQDARQIERDRIGDSQNAAYLRIAQANAARAGEDKFTIREQTDPNTGATTLVRVKTTGPEGPINSGVAVPSQPNNPFAVGPKLNTDQSKSATMTDRMADANGVITKNENINDGTGKPLGIAQAIPFVRDSALFNVVASPERQQVVQAQRNFVNAILRVESGAAISEGEFNNAQRQYFPQVGDSKEVIEQKRQNRVTAMKGMAREAGPNYRPPEALTAIPPGQSQRPVAQQQPTPQPQQAAPLSNGATATNPKTGERIIFQNGQWVPFT